MLKTILKVIKYILLGIFVPLGIFLLYQWSCHLFAPKYKFPPPKAFQGDLFFNPYKNIDTSWQKGNFHMHSRAWGGITNGGGHLDHQLWDTYHNLSFNSISISNYQNINKLYCDSTYYIPVYEHGYSIYKNHHLSIGAKKVVWFDMIFKQTLSQKQYMIDILKKYTELLSVNHPSFCNGFQAEDFNYLTGYDFIEVLNGYRNSIPHWDSALTAGRPALIMANDDMHDLNNPKEPARRFLMINAASNSRTDIMAALKNGKAFGVFVITPENETWNRKKLRLQNLTTLKNVDIKKDTLFITMMDTVPKIEFYGNKGKLLQTNINTNKAFYVIQPEDCYIRPIIHVSTPELKDGIQYFLNPIMRSTDGNIPQMPSAIVDTKETFVFRLIVISSFIFLILNFLIIRKKIYGRKKQ